MPARVESGSQGKSGELVRPRFIEQVGILADGQKTLATHQEIAAAEGVRNPYFDFTNTGEKLFHRVYRNGLAVKIGRLGSFTSEEMAIFIQASTQVYVTE